METKAIHKAEVMEVMEYVGSKEDPLIWNVKTYQDHINSTLLQTVQNLKKSFEGETKEIKNIIAQNIKGKWEEKRIHGQFPQLRQETGG
jgi:hypothetical protein